MRRLLTPFYRLYAEFLSWCTPVALRRLAMSPLRGTPNLIRILHAWITVKDKPNLLEKNPTAHHYEAVKRRKWLFFAVIAYFITWLIISLKFPIITFFGVYTASGSRLWLLINLFALAALGRTEPFRDPEKAKYLARESVIRAAVDELTLSQGARNREARTRIARPPMRLRNNTGYDVVVRIDPKGSMDKLFQPELVAHQLQAGKDEVFIYQDPKNMAKVRIMVLDKSPWVRGPSSNPLVVSPQRVNLWQYAASLGLLPDSTPFVAFLVEEGDGLGILMGGAARMGKTTSIWNLLVVIMLDPFANIRMIDGKGVDFDKAKAVCNSYVGEKEMEAVELLREALTVLKILREEIYHRKNILRGRSAFITEALCREFNLQLEFLVIDELAVFTEDMKRKTETKQLVLEFLDDLSYLVRVGPAFGIYVILSTQRPGPDTVPDNFRASIRWRHAFYVGSSYASLAILGKGGLGNRADHLDPDQQGVSIISNVGPIRWHLVRPDDVPRVVDYALALRGAARDMPIESLPDGMVYGERPASVVRVLEVFRIRGNPDFIPTSILKELLGMTSRELNAVLNEYNVEPTRNRTADTPHAVWGFTRKSLEAVPRVVTQLGTVSGSVSSSDTETSHPKLVEMKKEEDQ